MPYVKSIPIRDTVRRSIEYILNPDKTDKLFYTASLNCMTEPKDAYLNMKMVYEQYSGKKYNEHLPIKGKGRVKAIHYIQSFDPNDNITPELAFRIGKAFALKTFGENCQVVIATHCDKSHIHNHLILNSYGIDGKKFYDNKTTLNKIREYSDRVCLAFGIQPFDKSKGKDRTVAYNEWEHRKRGTSWKQKIKNAVDSLIGTVKNIDELLGELERQGFTVKRGKYISVKADGQQRFVRLKTLGNYYCEEILAERIKIALDEKEQVNELNSLFYERIYQVSELARSGQKVQQKYNPQLPYSENNDLTVYKLAAQLSVINRDKISSIGQLKEKICSLKSEYENAVQEFNVLTDKLSQYEAVLRQGEMYFSLLDKNELSVSDELKLKMHKAVMDKYIITCRENLESIRKLHDDAAKKAAALYEQFDNCKKLYDVYADIADTYYKISKGDYISNLIEEKKREGEKSMYEKNHKLKGR